MGIAVSTPPTIPTQIKTMAKDKEQKKERIVALLREDTYSVTELTRIVGCDRSVYYDWLKDDPDFAQAVQEAKEEFRAKMTAEAKNSLRKLIQGYTAEETTIISVPSKTKFDPNGNPLPVIKEQKTIRKPVPPNTGAVIFALTNVDPDNWKNRQEFTGNTKLTHEYSAEDIPDDLLKACAEKMQEKESKRERERRGL